MRRTAFFGVLTTLVTATITTLPSTAGAAGQVEVSFKPVDQLADVGRGSGEGERTVKLLTEHFRTLAARLPDGRTLKVEVLDIDLAGEMKPTRRGSEVRVMKGSADWPTLDLRWTLSGDGRTLASGQERLADMAYLSAGHRARADGALPFETRLIDRWFDERFGPAAAR